MPTELLRGSTFARLAASLLNGQFGSGGRLQYFKASKMASRNRGGRRSSPPPDNRARRGFQNRAYLQNEGQVNLDELLL